MDLLTAPRGELLKLVYELIEENECLKAQLAELQDQLANNSQRGTKEEEKKKVPVFVKPNRQERELKERKQRSQGYARTKETPTKTVFHALDVCPTCHGQLGKPIVSYRRQVIDIPQVEFEVTEYVVCKRWCFNCKKSFTPKVDLSNHVVGKQRIGINLSIPSRLTKLL